MIVAGAIALAGCGGGGPHAPTKNANAPTKSADASPGGPVVETDHRATRRRPAVPPAIVHLRAAMRKAFRGAGPHTGAAVVDLATGSALFALRDGVGRPPASVEKLYTTIAALGSLGPGMRLHTEVLGAGHLGPGGVWHGDLFLRGGGDPTFGDGTFNRIWELGYGPTASQIVRQLTARGIRSVTGLVIPDESLFDSRRGGLSTNFAPDIPDFGGQLSALTFDHGAAAAGLSPATFAARQLATTMKLAHLNARPAKFTRRTPAHARRLAIVSSPPVSALIDLMNVPSDDLFAELLTKQLGLRFGGHRGTIAAGARVISHQIATFGLHPRILDGSGLSKQDRSTPRDVVALLRAVWHTPIGRALSQSLPVVGVNGTTRRIGVHTAAQGRCIAKTGTLNYVTNLAGYCHTRGGHMLAFALFIDGPSNEQALPMLSRMVAAVAKY